MGCQCSCSGSALGHRLGELEAVVASRDIDTSGINSVIFWIPERLTRALRISDSKAQLIQLILQKNPSLDTVISSLKLKSSILSKIFSNGQNG